jgi:hypothetical protein
VAPIAAHVSSPSPPGEVARLTLSRSISPPAVPAGHRLPFQVEKRIAQLKHEDPTWARPRSARSCGGCIRRDAASRYLLSWAPWKARRRPTPSPWLNGPSKTAGGGARSTHAARFSRPLINPESIREISSSRSRRLMCVSGVRSCWRTASSNNATHSCTLPQATPKNWRRSAFVNRPLPSAMLAAIDRLARLSWSARKK